MRILIYANTFQSISGGEVIAVEVAKKWLSRGHCVALVTTDKGKLFCHHRNLGESSIKAWIPSWIDKFGIYFSSATETILSVVHSLFFDSSKFDVIFAASIFWPDIFPAVISKIKNRKAKIIVGAYLIFPNPLKERYNGDFFKAIVLYLSQIVSLGCISKFASLVLTASELDRESYFNGRQLSDSSVIAIRGGVDIQEIDKVKNSKKKFDAIYLGRFHSQKGLLDLITVWKLVLKSLPNKKLLLVGSGPLESSLKAKVRNEKLGQWIEFSRPIDGQSKYKLLKSAKIFISSSQFDTGNIALDEAMACGIPGVVFDLPHLNYEAGVIKVLKGNIQEMAKAIIKILTNKKKLASDGIQARNFISQFDWNNRAQIIIDRL